MDAHAQLNTGIDLQRLADFHRTFHRGFGVGEKYQRHPISSRQPNPLTFRLRFLKMGRATDNPTQLRKHSGLVFDQYLGVTDHVHEKNMSDSAGM